MDSSWTTFRRKLWLFSMLLRGPASINDLIKAAQIELGEDIYPLDLEITLKLDIDVLRDDYGCRICLQNETGYYFLENPADFLSLITNTQDEQELSESISIALLKEVVELTLQQFMSVKSISDLASYIIPDWFDYYIRLYLPDMSRSLQILDKVAVIVREYLNSTLPINRRDALLRANKQLEVSSQEIQRLSTSDSITLNLIIVRWRHILALASPVTNPYVAGNPVTGTLFVGREDIMLRLEELWYESAQPPSVMLYGHRRMGKSSILRNLTGHVAQDICLVDFNMQRVGMVANTSELLYNLALALYDSLHAEQRAALGEPQEDHYQTNNPYTIFDRLLKQIDRVRGERRFIITVDEFELIEELINRSKLEPQLLGYWRSLIQSYPWFVMAFAGLHTLEEMREDYWHPLFGSVTAIPISFLSPAGARRLITQPTPDFDLDYDEDAIAAIIMLSGRQPYLVQLIGHALVTRFNRQTFEEGRERPRRFSLADVDAVISAPEFYRDGNAYFSGVWAQAAGDPPGQTAVLHALAGCGCATGLPFAALGDAVALPAEELGAALAALERHDIIAQREGHYAFTVELMRRWVEQRA